MNKKKNKNKKKKKKKKKKVCMKRESMYLTYWLKLRKYKQIVKGLRKI